MTVPLPAYLLLALAIACEVAGTTALKASDGMTRLWPSLVVVAGYGLAFLLLGHALRTLPVGLVYAIWAGLGVVGVALIGALLFGESFGATKTAGIALILLGVVLVKTGG